jgi:mRNA interferase MazF
VLRASSLALSRRVAKRILIKRLLMIDKLTTVPKARLGKRLGKLNGEPIVRLNRALTVFLGLAR